MKDFIIILVLIAIFTMATRYIIKAKKSGAKCIGCPHAKECGKKKCTSGENKITD